MKESWRKINCTKIQITPPDNNDTVWNERKPWKKLDFIFSIFLYIILILTIVATIFILRRIHVGEKSPTLAHVSKNELKDMVKSIINDEFHEIFANKGLSKYTGKEQLMGEKEPVWSYLDERIDESELIPPSDSKSFENEMVADKKTYYKDYSEDYIVQSIEVSPDFVRRPRSTDGNLPSLLPRLVNCARFRPVSQSKYLISSNLEALHTCYRSGIRLDELEIGVVRHDRNKLKYDLENLYLKCEEVFTQAVQFLTPELAEDYRRCKRSGSVHQRDADFIERRFAQSLAEYDRETETTEISIPENLQSSTTSLPRLDIRAFVNCAHVEYQSFDSPESPNEAALLRCERHGVTVEEIERDIASNPQSVQYRFDTNLLYIPCEEAFASGLDWITDDLIRDYRRCKSLGLISEHTRRIIEDTFYEHINGGAPEESPVKSTTESSAPTTTTASEATTTTASEATTMPDIEATTMPDTEATTSPATAGRHAFANCRRIENKPYRICIKVIASYSGPPTAYGV